MKKTIILNGRKIEYELTRKRVKNINLRVRSDGVHVSAGRLVPLAVIESFMRNNAEYILRALDKMQSREQTACDIAEENWLSAGTITAVGAVLFRNCAYGTATYAPYKVAGDATNTLRSEFVADGSVAYKFGVDGVKKDPGFVGATVDPENPFALSRKSTLRKKGAYADWMATATDIRGAGYARTRDGKVDIGCYECLIPDPGFLLLFR